MHMAIRRTFGMALAALGVAVCGVAYGQATAPGKPRALSTAVAASKGDLDALVERRAVRVLVPYSRTLYYNDKGRERGITADLVRRFEKYLNAKYGKTLGKRPITVFMIPTTRDRLLQEVVAGRGDIAAGNLTVTEERAKLVDFVAPEDQKPVAEVVLTGPKSPAVAAAEDLSGRTVHVRKASSYHDSLVALNARLAQAGKAPAKIVLVPDALEDEDMMEMLNAGLLEAIVVDDWKARIWAQVLPKVKVNEGAVLRSGGRVGWAIRKDSPQLAAVAGEFYANDIRKQNLMEAAKRVQFDRVRRLKDPTASSDAKRFEQTLVLFRKYGTRYGFDPLMLAAQGYQESQLDQNAKSPVGAVGVMQLMPATGKELGVGDIQQTEPNIHAGAKYMDQLMTKYFPDAKFSEQDRSLFAFAAYNAGPGRIAQMRTQAGKRGLDPDKWFNHVEVVTAEKVGIETTTYVRNIYKYYAAYRLMTDVQEAQAKAREQAAR